MLLDWKKLKIKFSTFSFSIFLTEKLNPVLFNCRNSYRNKKWSMIILSHQPRLRINILFHIYRRSFFSKWQLSRHSFCMQCIYHVLYGRNNMAHLMVAHMTLAISSDFHRIGQSRSYGAPQKAQSIDDPRWICRIWNPSFSKLQDQKNIKIDVRIRAYSWIEMNKIELFWKNILLMTI